MPLLLNLEGRKFNRLLVIKRGPNTTQGKAAWICLCDCGKTVTVRSVSLTRGYSGSCGCFQKEIIAKLNFKHGDCVVGHESRLYHIWHGIKQRCNDPESCNYKNYGRRGISLCSEWSENYLPFYEWSINNGYREDLSIERIDNNGNYEPLNCTWATAREQSLNKRTNRLISFNGETKTISQWSEIYGVDKRNLRWRIERGWSAEQAITTPLTRFKKHVMSKSQHNEYLKRRET